MRDGSGGFYRRTLVGLQIIARLLQHFTRIAILFADHIERIVVEEPSISAVFARLNTDIRLMCLREK